MRKTLLLTIVLLVFAAWAVAQQGSNSQAPSTSSPSQGASSQPSGQASPDSSTSQSSTDQASKPASGENGIEGCLGGSAGNYTIIDKAGTSYKLQLPPNADTSALDKNIGKEVRVTGTVGNAAGSASGSSSSTDMPKGSSQASINVMNMQTVADTCSTNTKAPASSK